MESKQGKKIEEHINGAFSKKSGVFFGKAHVFNFVQYREKILEKFACIYKKPVLSL